MGETTTISWADHTGNPWVGCTVAHAGCLNCYARDFSQRKRGRHGAKASRPWALWGPGQDRYVTKGFWTDAPRWARQARQEGVRRTLFASLMDPLDPEVYGRTEAPDGVACRRTFDAYMRLLRRVVPMASGLGGLVPLLLTKRPENWRWIPEDVRPYCWLLYSASDQETLDAGVPHLLAAEGFAGLGLSLEPLVGPVDLSRASWGCGDWCEPLKRDSYRGGLESHGLGWVIVGGESGRNARVNELAWHRSILRQCRDAGVAFYEKQLGRRPTGIDDWGWPITNNDGHGANPALWPEDLRVQEFPEGLR